MDAIVLRRLARHAAAVFATAALLHGSAALAQPGTADASLYQALGGAGGIAALVERFHSALLVDPRTEPFFRDADHARLKQQLAIQLCEVAGGPCRLEGKDRDMRARHDGQDITKGDFNAVVEVLQLALDGQDVPFSMQNRLLARLAPMHREIVNAKK